MRENAEAFLVWLCSVILVSLVAVMELPQKIKAMRRSLATVAERPVFDLSPYRKPMAILLVFLVPIFICFGFGVQAIDVINDSTSAMGWFVLSAILAAVLVLIWEEIVIPNPRHRAYQIVLLEGLVVLLFYMGANWVKDKAVAFADTSIKDVIEKSVANSQYNKVIQSAKHPEQTASISQPISPVIVRKEKPDIAIALVYPQEFATMIINRSSEFIDKPKWGYAIWDMDKTDAFGNVLVLPIKTQQGDWIRGHEALGPESAIGDVEGLITPGDRLFGYIYVTCPDCEKTRSYWVYAKFKEDGWFEEITGGYPDLSQFTGATMKQIASNLDDFLRSIPEKDRIPIYKSIRDIRMPHS